MLILKPLRKFLKSHPAKVIHKIVNSAILRFFYHCLLKVLAYILFYWTFFANRWMVSKKLTVFLFLITYYIFQKNLVGLINTLKQNAPQMKQKRKNAFHKVVLALYMVSISPHYSLSSKSSKLLHLVLIKFTTELTTIPCTYLLRALERKT
jgi:hypothetical protein